MEKGNTALVYDYHRAAPAMDLALEYARDSILPADIELAFYYKDGGNVCSANNEAIHSALDWVAEGINCDIYIGPGCDRSVADLYRIAEYRQAPIIGCPSANIEGNTGLKRSEMPYLIRPAYSFTDICRLVVIFLNTFNYTHTTLLTDETSQFFSELGNTLTIRYRQEREDLYLQAKLLLFRSNEATEERYRALLMDASRRSRVVILFANATVVRKIMICARTLGLTDGNYVYIAVELFKSKSWGEFNWMNHDVHERDAQSAYRSLALLALYETRDQFFTEFQKEVRRRAKKYYNYIYGAFEEVDPVVTSYYDAVIIYASAISRLHRLGGNVKNGTLIALTMTNTSVPSPLGYLIDIDEDGDRTRAYSLKQMSPESGKFEDILRIDYSNFETIWYGKFKWPDRDGLPPNEPICGFDGLGIACQPPLGLSSQPGSITGLALGLLVVAAASGIGGYFLITKMKANSANNDPFWWRIQKDELKQLTGRIVSTSSNPVSSVPSGLDGRLTSTISKSNWSNARGEVAMYRGVPVCIIEIPKKIYKPTANLVKELNQVRAVIHPNLHRFVGLCLDDSTFCESIVGEVCVKGTLETILESDKLELDWAFKYSLLKDLIEGMEYLHASAIGSHGFLTGFNCLVDGRFVLKITNYGISAFVNPADLEPPDTNDKRRNEDSGLYTLLLWRAPELLRLTMPARGTQKGDIYSFAIVLQQIILRSSPYSSGMLDGEAAAYSYQESPKTIVLEVKEGNIPPMRPVVPRTACRPELYQLMENCWSEFALTRPPFTKIKEIVKKIVGKGSANIVDYLLARMEQYANNLEEQVVEKTRQFMEEKKRSEELLGQLLPKVIAAALTKGETVAPESYDSVSIYFSDIVGFTTICASIAPMEVVSLLNNLYTLFDGVLENYDVYKVETIGDAYMVSSGLPVRNGKRHVSEIANVALHIRRDISNFEVPKSLKEKLQVRIGINSGSCVAGIVGHKMPRYCLFGDTVNVASRMESTGEPMRIQISEKTKEFLENIGGFVVHDRGEIYVKGKGTMKTFWLIGRAGDNNSSVIQDEHVREESTNAERVIFF
ncbi:Atrial natriuretic peptide receptor 1 [Hypsibius exemplaris]|uniref:Guanylate cyclase n=1 Tax=Hypsibius exemplaris TaxID=2072580 RepID=A0A1W0WPA3_HYPEX|nr:Atrial natriuretic peptide receptor 1 [Hypsibius exemplaris]